MQALMRHKADVWRPSIQQATAQEIEGYSLVYSSVPCFVQPLDVKEAMYYEQRGQEGVASIYTTDTTSTFQRNDIFEVGGVQFHIVGIKTALLSPIYRELTGYFYPENARKRLNREAYE